MYRKRMNKIYAEKIIHGIWECVLRNIENNDSKVFVFAICPKFDL